MKVLFATYPMAFHTPGGGEIQLMAYKKFLPEFGVEVSLFDPWNPEFKKYDIVHFFSCILGSVHFCAFIKRLGIPLVISSSLWITEETKHLYGIDEIRTQLSQADKVVANSNIEGDTLSHIFSLPREKFATVYNGVDPLFFKKVTPDLFRQKFGIAGRFVLNVGNIEPRKNQLMLARAMKSMPDLKLVLIGHARDPHYKNQVLAEGGSQVIYTGPIPHDSELLRSAYAACEVFCLPSTLETPGLAALEADVQGCRIAVTSEGSTQEYFKDTVAYLDHRSEKSIENAIRKALVLDVSGKPDPNSDAKFSWRSVLTSLNQTYRSLL